MLDLSKLIEAVASENGVSRRLFLAYAASLAAIPLLGVRTQATTRRIPFASNPFSLGVASGDPDESSVVLWTRLAPKPLEPDSGMPRETFDVRWEIAHDEAMTKIVKSGTVPATPRLGHSVHVEAAGLEPDRWYFYRFRVGDADSPVGRTRTTPKPDTNVSSLRFAFASCQHFEQGYFTAYEGMMKDDLDLVFHLGDYIYEGGSKDKLPRQHLGHKLRSVEDYRLRFAQYKADPLLHGMHARCPWVVTWDDHEVENDYANDFSHTKGTSRAELLTLRAAAYQGYYENMPLRARSLPKGPDMQLYRTIRYGRLAAFQVLDTRQYRSPQPNNDTYHDINADAENPKNTILGGRQNAWLRTALDQSPAAWNVLAQQVPIGMLNRGEGMMHHYHMDKWTGYMHDRVKLVDFLATHKIANPVILTGDVHQNFVNDIRVDDRKMELPVVATELVGTSIASGGDGVDRPKEYDAILTKNPFMKFFNRQRGYVRCTLTPKELRSDFRVVDRISTPGGSVTTRGTFVVETGQAGAKPT